MNNCKTTVAEEIKEKHIPYVQFILSRLFKNVRKETRLNFLNFSDFFKLYSFAHFNNNSWLWFTLLVAKRGSTPSHLQLWSPEVEGLHKSVGTASPQGTGKTTFLSLYQREAFSVVKNSVISHIFWKTHFF